MDARTVLDFGAGDGFFVEKFYAGGLTVDAVEQDASLQDRLRPYAGQVWANIGSVLE